MKTFTYTCSRCNQVHEGMPSFSWQYPIEYLTIPEVDRKKNIVLTEDTCVISNQWYFIRCCLEIPVHGQNDPLIWGVWCSVSSQNFKVFCDSFQEDGRSNIEPFFAWLTAVPPTYPDAQLKTMIHLRPRPTRPYVELEPTEHPLAIDQKNGMCMSRVQEISEYILHGKK